jgi:endoglucanase
LNTRFLFEILQTPTAPFREEAVMALGERFCRHHGVAHFRDPHGNLVLGARNSREYAMKVRARSKKALFFFIAHADHPGFHGVRWLKKGVLQIAWHGGSPRAYLSGAPVWACGSEGVILQGRLSAPILNRGRNGLERARVVFSANGHSGLKTFHPSEIFGGFSFRKPVWRSGKVVYTKAADDLVGTFVLFSLARRLNHRGKNFLALVSRAEEVGFIGTIRHLDLGWLKRSRRPVVCVSVETSRELPGAQIGKGPIIRLGDKATVFHPLGTAWLSKLARKKLGNRYQRRIMDGGTCEGTVTTAHGFPTIGLSIPLGNYHNQGLELGPDSRGKLGPSPEFVHLGDVKGAIEISQAIVNRPTDWPPKWDEKLKYFKHLKALYQSHR